MNEGNIKLPLLRQEISVTEGGFAWNGAPTWLLHDGFRNKYFRIDQSSFELISLWRAISIEKFTLQASARLKRAVTTRDVEALIEFLYANSLTQDAVQDSTKSSWEALYNQSIGSKKHWLKALAHNYIFFRVPLVRPQEFLDATWPYISWLFTKKTAITLTLLALLGLYLVSRQWLTFQNTFMEFLTLKGFALYGISLIFIKAIHELGHAFMAKKYNVDVPIIGAAFIVLMPILYTDTTNATALADRRNRLMIDFAGIFSELALASIATILWVFLPDGPLRSVAFTTATISWIMSLFVNLNPLMKFDGYYILADFFGIENLQERGFAIAKWKLREILFGLNKPSPEAFPNGAKRALFLHAWATWIYRFFLFLGIAIIVYAFFIKIIGIILFILEILWFILLPIFRELKHWWSIKKEIFVMKRYLYTGGFLLGLAVLFFAPISTKLSVPTILAHQNKTTLYAPMAGKIVELNLREGMQVTKGQILARMASEEINSEIKLKKLEIELLRTRLARISVDQQIRATRQVLEQELGSQMQNLEGLIERQSKLVIKAPASGMLSSVDPELSNGIWLNSKFPLAVVKPQNGASFLGYVSESDYDRLSANHEGIFIADGGQHKSIKLKVNKIASVSTSIMDEPYLADVYGGELPSLEGSNEVQNKREVKLRGGWYALEMEPLDDTALNLANVVRGAAIIDAKSSTISEKFIKRIASVLIREAGI